MIREAKSYKIEDKTMNNCAMLYIFGKFPPTLVLPAYLRHWNQFILAVLRFLISPSTPTFTDIIRMTLQEPNFVSYSMTNNIQSIARFARLKGNRHRYIS